MSEVEIQQPECAKCGVEVRPNTDFCYNCGAPVTAEAAELVANGAGAGYEEKSSGKNANLSGKKEHLSLQSEAGIVTDETVNGNTNGLSAGLEDRRPSSPKYESAAGLRRKSKTATRKPVEVTWEPEGESLNLKFVIGAICCLVLAILLVTLAMYLK